MTTISKQVAINTQDLRKFKPSVADPFVLKTDHAIFLAQQREHESYVSRCKSSTTPTSLPPWYYTFPAMMDALLACDIGGQNRAILEPWVTSLFELEESQLLMMSPLVEVEGMYDKTLKRVWLALENVGVGLREVIIRSMIQAGAVYRPGKAPAGWLENQLSQYIDAFSR